MLPRERVWAALRHAPVDRVPRFEIWIDALLAELGVADQLSPHAALGQDGVLLPMRSLPGSNAWRTGVDEWGRVWRDGKYAGGVVQNRADIAAFSPPLSCAEQMFDETELHKVRTVYSDHCMMFGTHIGPFTAGYMAMGFAAFFSRMLDDPAFIEQLLEFRTDWCIAVYRQALSHGAELLVLGDDAGSSTGPMISPRLWRRLVLPYHRRIVEALGVPVIWHSDGNIEALLPMAVEAGFAGIHGLDPLAGMNLARVKREFGKDLVLVGNVDNRVLFQADLSAVRAEVERCLREGAPGGGYMLASCNSICEGMHPAAVAEMFRCEAESTVQL